MLGNFDIPSVDHLREGIDYTILDWDFAAGQPVSTVPHTPGQPCPPNFKMVFGICRRLKQGTGDWDPNDESDMERAGKMEAQKQGSTFETNKPVDIGGKKYGWAKKNGKDVLVAWGSICAKKDKDGNCISSTGQVTPKQPAAPSATPAASTPPATPATSATPPAAPQQTTYPVFT